MKSDENVKKTENAYKRIFSEYASSNKNLRTTVKKKLDYFISKLKGKAVLDVGCASGVESEYLQKHGLKVVGIDISGNFIELAKKRCPECTFVIGDMRDLDFSKDSFDGVWASASFLHIPKEDSKKTLTGFNRILKTGGLLYVSVMEGIFNGLRENKQMNWPERHFSDYTEDELEKLLDSVAFTVFKKQKVESGWGPTFLHFFAIKK